MASDAAELLKQVPLFAGCSKAELREVALSTDEIDLRSGHVLTREGRSGREFFILVEGTASVTQDGTTIAELSGGDWFGEIALLTHRPRTRLETPFGSPTRRRPAARPRRTQLEHAIVTVTAG